MRQFLLDYLDMDERERIEEQFILNPAFRQKLLIAEETLIEEYLEDSLNETDRNQFQSVFLSSAQQRQKLAFARAITVRSKAEVITMSAETETISEPLVKPKAGQQVKSSSRILLIAAALLIVIFATLWMIQRKPGNESAADRTRRLAVQAELAELNSGSKSVLPAEMVSIVLAPVNTRGSGPLSLSRRTGVSVFEFWLLPTAFDNDNFKALVRKDGVNMPLEVTSLALTEKAGGRAVRLRIPARLLDQGAYLIELRSITHNGESAYAGEYRFQVVD